MCGARAVGEDAADLEVRRLDVRAGERAREVGLDRPRWLAGAGIALAIVTPPIAKPETRKLIELEAEAAAEGEAHRAGELDALDQLTARRSGC